VRSIAARVWGTGFAAQWLDDEEATLDFGADRLLFTFMNGTTVETQLADKRPERRLLSTTTVHKLLMRKSTGQRDGQLIFSLLM
jgi:hypothetical protein